MKHGDASEAPSYSIKKSISGKGDPAPSKHSCTNLKALYEPLEEDFEKAFREMSPTKGGMAENDRLLRRDRIIVEITAPDQSQFSIIDLPGLLQSMSS